MPTNQDIRPIDAVKQVIDGTDQQSVIVQPAIHWVIVGHATHEIVITFALQTVIANAVKQSVILVAPKYR